MAAQNFDNDHHTVLSQIESLNAMEEYKFSIPIVSYSISTMAFESPSRPIVPGIMANSATVICLLSVVDKTLLVCCVYVVCGNSSVNAQRQEVRYKRTVSVLWTPS